MKIFLSSRDISGYNVSTYKSFKPKLYHENLKTLLALLHTKMITPVIATQLPLEDAARAHELFESGTTSGRIVLVCNS